MFMLNKIAVLTLVIYEVLLLSNAHATAYFYTGEASAHINYYRDHGYLNSHEDATGHVFAKYDDIISLLTVQILFIEAWDTSQCTGEPGEECGLPSEIAGQPFVFTMEKIIESASNNPGIFDPYDFEYLNGTISERPAIDSKISFFTISPPELIVKFDLFNHKASTFQGGHFSPEFNHYYPGTNDIFELMIDGSFTSCHVELPEPSSLFLIVLGSIGLFTLNSNLHGEKSPLKQGGGDN